MAIETLVKEIQEYIASSQERKGAYSLVMLAGLSDLIPGRWNLILSAPWIDSAGRRAALMEIVPELQTTLSKEAQMAIERLSVLRTHEPIVRELANTYHLPEPSHVAVRDLSVNGYHIPHAVLILARADSSSRQPSG
jgi:hypothetical protein